MISHTSNPTQKWLETRHPVAMTFYGDDTLGLPLRYDAALQLIPSASLSVICHYMTQIQQPLFLGASEAIIDTR